MKRIIGKTLHGKLKKCYKDNEYKDMITCVRIALRMFLAASHEERMRYRK